jgi:hypothetical protein
MAIQQEYRGNPALKQYQLTQNFVGGLNTKAADDVVTDVEFRELLNADLGNQGIITNRKGFKDLVVFNAMAANAVDEKGDPVTLPQGIYRLAKVAKDPQDVVSQLSRFESLSDFRTFLQPIAYEFIIIFLVDSNFYRLKVSKNANQSAEKVELQNQLQITTGTEKEVIQGELEQETNKNTIYFSSGVSDFIFTLPYTNLNPIPSDYELTSVTLKTIEYQVLTGDPLEGELKLLFPVQNNPNNPDNALVYTDVNLPNTNLSFEPIPGFEDLNLDIKRDFYSFTNPNTYFGSAPVDRFVDYTMPDNGPYNTTLAFRFVIEYVYTEKFSDLETVTLDEYKSKLSVNNVEFLDSVYILPNDGQIYEYKILEDRFERVSPFQPTPFDVKFVGFNVFATNPLTFIADQGTSIKSIQGMFLTVDNNKPVQNMPGGIFELNIIHTGEDFTVDEVGVKFIVDYQTDDEFEIFPLLISARDEGGLFIFQYNAVGLSKYAGSNITINLYEIDDTLGSNVTEDVSSSDAVNIAPPSERQIYETTIEVVDSSVFIVDKQYVLSQSGRYESVKVKEIINSTSLKVYGRLRNVYLEDSTPRLYELAEKLENLTFDPFFDQYTIISGYSTLPQAVTQLDLKDFKMIEINYRMLYYGGKTIWFSDLYQFNYIPNYNFISLPLGTTDEIQRIVFFRGAYIIFTKEEIYKLIGTFGQQDFALESVNKFVGCISPNTVRNVGNELFFLTRDGLYKLKSSVFQDNLENVEKIDKPIADDVQISQYVDSLLYDEQYILYYNEGESYDTLRMYYDIDLGRSRNPFVRDIFTLKPELLVSESGQIFALNNGRWFVYGEGFTDFMPDGEQDATNYIYTCRIETPSLSLRFPTHEKKFKNIFIKALHGNKIVPLFVTVKVDNYDVLIPSESTAFVNPFGEVEYVVSPDPNITLQSSAFLGQMELANTPLGEITQQLHKLSFSGKGKNIKVIIEQQLDASFGIISIGYLFKLGKVKE